MSATSEILLAGTGLSKRYAGNVALHDTSLGIARGSITALIGPNGAGKTTLFDLLAGFLRSDSGHVKFCGNDVTAQAAYMRARRGLVKTFQVPHEFHSLTVLDNLLVAAPRQLGERFPAVLYRLGRIREDERALSEQAEEILTFLDLERVREHPAGLLSGGQKKLLELGRVLMLKPICLLLDEPFAGVRPALVRNILDHLVELRRRGLTLVVVEHNLQAIMSIADFVYVLVDGQILASGEPAAIQSDDRVLAAYLGGAL